MSNKAKERIINNIKSQIKIIQKNRNDKEVAKLSSIILGFHNYYNKATDISKDLAKLIS